MNKIEESLRGDFQNICQCYFQQLASKCLVLFTENNMILSVEFYIDSITLFNDT